MKKFLIGCGIIVLLIIIVVVGGIIWAAMKVSQVQSQWKDSAKAVSQLEQRYTFTPPAGPGEPYPQERVQAYFTIRGNMFDMIGQNETIGKMTARGQGEQVEISLGEAARFLTTFPPALLREYESQLSTHTMPPSEYTYWTRAVYTTIKLAAENGNQDMRRLYNDLQSGQEIFNNAIGELEATGVKIDVDTSFAEIAPASETVAPENIELIQQHAGELKRAPEFVFFELWGVTLMEEAEK